MNKQEAVPQEAYDEAFWKGETHDWWQFGAEEDGKRKSEGQHPDRIKQCFGDDIKVLDAGCGRGFLVKFLREVNVDAVGVDYSKYAVEHAAAKGHVAEADVTNLPFEDNSKDLVISREIFEHLTLEQSKKAFEEMIRVSKKYIYLTIWMNFDEDADDDIVLDDFDRDPTHITYCTRNFWEKRLGLYVNAGILKRRKDLEEVLDWCKKGRCFVFEKADS